MWHSHPGQQALAHADSLRLGTRSPRRRAWRSCGAGGAQALRVVRQQLSGFASKACAVD
jgi:hypothetical protein